MSMIEVTNLRKSFGALEVLRDVSFRVEKGDVVAVIGSSGSGKSTLLRCLIGLEEVTGGSIRIDGQDLCRDGVYASAAARKAIILRMGMVFQHFNLYPHLSVVKNLRSRRAWSRAARGRICAPRPWSCWARWAWPTARTRCRAASPAGRSSAWPSPAR